jgi:hypothetical protein
MAGVKDQATPELAVPFTRAVNCVDWPRVSEAAVGDNDTKIAPGCNATEALAVLFGEVTLVAITVTVVCAFTDAGAV